MMDYTLITDAAQLADACGELERLPVIGVDSETTDLDPLVGRPRLLQLAGSPEHAYVIDLDRLNRNGALDPLRRVLAAERPIKVLHNAKFDYRFIRHHLGATINRPWCTMLADQLLTSNNYTRGLAVIAQEYAGLSISKEQQRSDWSGELSRLQLEYAARDGAALLTVYERMREQLLRSNLRQAAILEFDCVAAIAEIELAGMPVDRPALAALADSLDRSRAAAAEKLIGAFAHVVPQPSLFGAPEINLDSAKEVSELLRRLGVPIKDSTGDEELKALADDYPVVQLLRDYRGAAKLSGTYGRPLIAAIHPQTGRIHPDVQQIGAGTGRCSCNDPNLQNIPSEADFRGCFAAPPGRVLVDSDYSQIELRILAQLSRDEMFADAFRRGIDFHTATAIDVLGDESQRAMAKRLNFGIVYGLGVPGLARRAGVTEERAKYLIDRYFATYPNVDRYLKQSEQQALRHGEIRTASQRRILYRFDKDDRAARAAVARAARNGPIQGTSADILKRALHHIASRYSGTDVRIVNIVHDEIIVECDEQSAEGVQGFVRAAMLEAAYEFVPDIPIVVDQKVTPRWIK